MPQGVSMTTGVIYLTEILDLQKEIELRSTPWVGTSLTQLYQKTILVYQNSLSASRNSVNISPLNPTKQKIGGLSSLSSIIQGYNMVPKKTGNLIYPNNLD